MNQRVASILLFVCLASVVFAQGTTSRATGVIQDSTGAVVPAATVRLINEGTNTSFLTTSAANGVYFFEAVQTGSYTLTVEAQGFKKFTSKGNSVTIGQPMTINVTLEVGAVAESVEVAATYESVQTSASGNFGNLLAGQVIRDLPIVGTRGRNPLELVERMPGVVSGANTGGGTHVHGSRDRAWNFTLDGIDINDFSAGGSNFAPLRTNPDMLAEFRLITSNPTAEYGRSSGAQVSLVTKSGTNDVHGTAFWFYRTPRLNANEWEANLNSVGKRQFVQNIPGGSIGGPIKRNKLFYFANIQWLRARESAVTDRTVYTESARRGILRYNRSGQTRPAGVAGAAVDASGNVLAGINLGTYNVLTSNPQRLGVNRQIADLIARTPLPNNFTGGDGLNTAFYTFTALQFEKQYDFTGKLDYNLNDKNQLYARVSLGQQVTRCDRVNGGRPLFPGLPCHVDTSRIPRNYAYNWRTTPKASLTNELVFGINNYTFDFFLPAADFNKITLVNTPVTVPEDFTFGNLRELTNYQIVDNAAWFNGAHNVKFGVNLRFQRHRDRRGSIGGGNAGQTVNFSTAINAVDVTAFGLPADLNQAVDLGNFRSHINFLLGRVGSTTKAFVAEGDQFVPQLYQVTSYYPEYDFYLQDNWKVRRTLTIDYGLRWEMKMSPTASDNKLLRPNQVVAAGAAPSNALRWVESKLYNDDRNNISPSIGIAWDPFGKGRTSLRANYRTAFDRINTFVFSSSVLQNLPGIAIAITNQEYGQNGGLLDGLQPLQPPSVRPSSFRQPPAFSANSITVVDPSFRAPLTHQWGVSIQHEVFPRTVVEVNYIGRRAYGLFGAYDTNQTEIFRNGFADAFRAAAGGGESPLLDRLTAPDTRRTGGESGAAFIRRLFPTEIRNGAVASVASAIGTRSQGGRSIPDLSGLGPYFFQAFPQFAGAMAVVDSNDFSTYHGLEMQLERRFSSGIGWQVSYTVSKALDTRSYDPAFTVVSRNNNQSASSTPFDMNNRKLNYALSDFDRTRVLQSYWTWELPFGNGRRWAGSAGPWLQRAVGGWTVAGFLTAQTGRPFTVYSGFHTFSSVVQSTGQCSGCTRADGRVFDDPQQGLKFYLDAAERARFAGPGAGELGNTGRNFFRGPGSFFINASFQKRIYISERWGAELRADMSNLTNTPAFDFPTATVSAATFGRIRDAVISVSRKIQLGAKISF
jgi:hypothetical protein